MLAREIGEFSEIVGGALLVVDRFRRNVGAQAKQARAELVHQFKLPRAALEIPRSNRIGHRLEVA